MMVGPLRRITAAIGLFALLPIAWLLAVGSLTPEEAAIRAIIVALVVVVIGNVLRTILTRMLWRVERRSADHDAVVDDHQASREGATGR